ncbi:MAG: glycosyltransferase [Acidobacteria bacterium]|nr:MAG: glycosyltransferase [Acidobacteriota bacterium]
MTTRTSRLRVLHCSLSQVRGGAEEHMLTLLRGLDPGRFELNLSCPPALLSHLPDLPAHVRLAPPPPRQAWRTAAGWRWRQSLRRERIQIVHAHLSSASRAVMPWVALTPGAVLVETPHVREDWRRGWKRSSWLDRAAGCGVAGYIAVSAANAIYLRQDRRLPEHKIRLIRNGINLQALQQAMAVQSDPRPELGIPPSEVLLVCAARLEPQKGHALLLEALARLRAAGGASFRLVCLGEGSLHARLQQQAQSLGLGAQVLFPGYCTHVAAWLAVADLFVLPSHYEGLPLAAMEAAAAGCVIVATAVDGTPEVVGDGRNGLLVPPGNAGALAQALGRLIADPQLRRQLGEHGRQRALREFDQQRQIAATADYYAELAVMHGLAPAATQSRLTPVRPVMGGRHG